ncbi:MAG: response regulator, partial [Proteobacteria bacterium]|nr:response regulator [Pseudomonadota bacterium]
DGFAVSFTDVSRRRQAEEERERALAARSQFYAAMSHEIRTPMNGVLGFTQLLQKSDLDNDQRDYVETIDKSAKSLLGIINDVLDVSKIEAGKLIIDSSGFDLRSCIADTLEALAPVAYEKNLELIAHVDASLPDGLRADPTRLRQMLTNLVGNAIKFTDSGHICVRVDKSNSENRFFRISVADTGRGITADDQDRLFNAFERGSVNLEGRYTGTGLGLVITKKLCEAMGGRIELESVPGRGTSVVLELPLVVDRNPENRYGFGKPLAGRKVLVIDPHTQSREALRARLVHWGADVSALADHVEAATEGVDLVVIGVERIRLGDTRGLNALCEKLPKSLPRICLAATVDRDALRSLAEACGANCVSKIGHLESQLRRISEALGIHVAGTRTEEAGSTRLHGLNVLVADDNRINRYFLKKILELHGAHVTEVDSGNGVLRTLDGLSDTETVDIALLDVHMPDMDGLEVARRIRSGGNVNLPLLAVSANVQAETYEAAISSGINDYLLKPVEETKLVEAVLEWTGREAVTSDE